MSQDRPPLKVTWTIEPFIIAGALLSALMTTSFFCCCGGFLILRLGSSNDDWYEEAKAEEATLHAEANELLTRADAAWDEGDEAAASELYEEILYGNAGMRYLSGNKALHSRLFRRLIDYRIEIGGLEAGRSHIEVAAKRWVPLSLSTHEANEFATQATAEYRERNRIAGEELRRKWAPEDAKNCSAGSVTASSGTTVDVVLLLRLRIGMSESDVLSLLGEPHEIATVDVPAIPQLDRPARTLVTWNYNSETESSFVLLFEDGVLQNGESGGYSLKDGFKLHGN